MAGTDYRQTAVTGGPAVILIEPQLGENIGTAARAMFNCGLTDMRLVKPRDGWPSERAKAAASGADIVLDNAKLFDRVTVAIAESAGKAPLFSAAERVAMVQPNVAKFAHVTVTTFDGLLVEFCQRQKADAIIRGLRALSDFEFEFNMALMNRHLEPGLEHVGKAHRPAPRRRDHDAHVAPPQRRRSAALHAARRALHRRSPQRRLGNRCRKRSDSGYG